MPGRFVRRPRELPRREPPVLRSPWTAGSGAGGGADDSARLRLFAARVGLLVVDEGPAVPQRALGVILQEVPPTRGARAPGALPPEGLGLGDGGGGGLSHGPPARRALDMGITRVPCIFRGGRHPPAGPRDAHLGPPGAPQCTDLRARSGHRARRTAPPPHSGGRPAPLGGCGLRRGHPGRLIRCARPGRAARRVRRGRHLHSEPGKHLLAKVEDHRRGHAPHVALEVQQPVLATAALEHGGPEQDLLRGQRCRHRRHPRLGGARRHDGLHGLLLRSPRQA
mmetsp:Transcript_24841/g.54914  ORF Transcript_24841/g.54914 Transcript_24841/m.54914 type:complete len:281 (-) Transcript_24841:378-1220(-)